MSTENIEPAGRRWALRLLLGAVATVAISSVLVGPAAAAPEFTELSVNSSDSQAGAHPDLNVRFQLEDETNEEVVRDLTFNLPQGVFGNPGAIYRCEAADFAIKSVPTRVTGGDRQHRLHL